MKSLQKNEGPPCTNMENLLQELAGGNLKGIRKLYTVAHAAHCNHCGNFLSRLKITVATLRASKAKPGDEESLKRLRELVRAQSGQ
jgi:hypothetical protein